MELILTVCALSAPDQCEEQRLGFVAAGVGDAMHDAGAALYRAMGW